MVVQIKSGKRENGKSFWDNLYRKRSIITNTKNKLKDLCGNRLWQDDFIITFCFLCLRILTGGFGFIDQADVERA